MDDDNELKEKLSNWAYFSLRYTMSSYLKCITTNLFEELNMMMIIVSDNQKLHVRQTFIFILQMVYLIRTM